MPTISAVMVVHDEEETLEQAVESIRGLVDEVVIGVDRKCTDKTPEIARRLASPGKYFEFDFNNDFSGARNKAIQRAEMEYCLIADGHEFVPDDQHPVSEQVARMRKVDLAQERVLTPQCFLDVIRQNGMPDDMDVVCITLAMNTDPAGIPQLFFLQPRIFRNNGIIHYESEVHNHLAGYRSTAAMGCPEGILVHNMPPKREEARKKQRAKMNFSGLLADVRRDRKKPLKEQDGRPYFYLGNSYADMGNNDKAIFWYEQYLKRSKFGEEKYQALQQLAVLYHRHRKDTQKARQYALEATMIQYRRSEPFILLGEISMEGQDWDQAIHWFKLAESIPAPHTVMFLQGNVYSFMPVVKLMLCYAAKGDWAEALRYGQLALQWHPGDPQLLQPMAEFQANLRKLENGQQATGNLLIVDRIGSFTGDMAGHFANLGWKVDRRANCDERHLGWADLAWFEWCDDNLIHWSSGRWNCPVVCRLHSYEAFSEMPTQVKWGNVDHLVFVAEHIREMFFNRWPELRHHLFPRTSVIHNGLRLEEFTFRERRHGNKVGCLGFVNHKKGMEGLLDVAALNPDLEFHVAGVFQDGHLAIWFEDIVAHLPNVWWHGEVAKERKDEWLDGIDYLISPSITESFGFTIAEAAAKGIKPLIRQRPGVHDLWPSDWIWLHPGDFRRVLEGEYNSRSYREWIEQHYSHAAQMSKTEELVARLRKMDKRVILPYATTTMDNLQIVTGTAL